MEYVYSLKNLRKSLDGKAGKEFVGLAKKLYEELYQGKPITVLSYAKRKLIHTTGERAPFEEEYFDRRRRLALLQILAVADDSYLGDLEDLLSAICEECTWVLPPHNAIENNCFDYTEIDLFSAETAFYLSETACALKEKLGCDIKSRINDCLYERIVKNFESREFVFDSLDNNWCAVCGAGVGITYLYAFPERFGKVKDRLFGLMDKYLSGIGEDGFCFEGANYWQYGFGFFALFFDVYVNLTGDYPEVLKSEKVFNTLNFLSDTYLDGKKYVPYGDGGIQNFTAYVDIFAGIKNLFKDKFFEPDCDYKDYFSVLSSGNVLKTFRKGLGFRAINSLNLFSGSKKKEDYICKYFNSAEVMVYRGKNYAFTTKCGNNGESHSHNDVGVFEIVKADKRLIADLGGGLYTWAYFNDYKVRYGNEVFVCGSQSHSVPIIDGKHQKEEKEFYGKVLDVKENFIKMDVATAYDKVINQMEISYELEETGVKATYAYSDEKPHQITYRFVSDFKPKKVGDKVIVDELEITCDKNLNVIFSDKEYVIRSGEERMAYIIDFVAESSKKDQVKFLLKIN